LNIGPREGFWAPPPSIRTTRRQETKNTRHNTTDIPQVSGSNAVAADTGTRRTQATEDDVALCNIVQHHH